MDGDRDGDGAAKGRHAIWQSIGPTKPKSIGEMQDAPWLTKVEEILVTTEGLRSEVGWFWQMGITAENGAVVEWPWVQTWAGAYILMRK